MRDEGHMQDKSIDVVLAGDYRSGHAACPIAGRRGGIFNWGFMSISADEDAIQCEFLRCDSGRLPLPWNLAEVIGKDNWTNVPVFDRYAELADSPKYAPLRLNAHSLLEKRTQGRRPSIVSPETRGEHLGPFRRSIAFIVSTQQDIGDLGTNKSKPANPPARGRTELRAD